VQSPKSEFQRKHYWRKLLPCRLLLGIVEVHDKWDDMPDEEQDDKKDEVQDDMKDEELDDKKDEEQGDTKDEALGGIPDAALDGILDAAQGDTTLADLDGMILILILDEALDDSLDVPGELQFPEVPDEAEY